MVIFGGDLGPREYRNDAGLASSVSSAIAIDSVCAGHVIIVTTLPGCIVLEGTVPCHVAMRAKEIARDVVGAGFLLDRMYWKE